MDTMKTLYSEAFEEFVIPYSRKMAFLIAQDVGRGVPIEQIFSKDNAARCLETMEEEQSEASQDAEAESAVVSDDSPEGELAESMEALLVESLKEPMKKLQEFPSFLGAVEQDMRALRRSYELRFFWLDFGVPINLVNGAIDLVASDDWWAFGELVGKPFA